MIAPAPPPGVEARGPRYFTGRHQVADWRHAALHVRLHEAGEHTFLPARGKPYDEWGPATVDLLPAPLSSSLHGITEPRELDAYIDLLRAARDWLASQGIEPEPGPQLTIYDYQEAITS